MLREQLPTPTPAPATITRITADQVVIAFQGDFFFSKYGQSTLLIEGTVASLSQQDSHPLIELKTADTTKVYCELGSQAAGLQVGNAITVQVANLQHNASWGTSAGDAAHPAVMLKNCLVK